MRQATRKSLITVAAAGGVLALAGSGVAYADAGAQGAATGSPGVLSGNNVQVPVHVPVNVCGNSVNVVGLLNPAFGNHCVNAGSHGKGHKKDHTRAGAEGGSSAQGAAVGSPGVGSGNNIQIPVDVPVNACGNTVDVVSALNPTFGNSCGNHTNPVIHKPAPHHPGHPHHPGTPDQPVHHTKPEQPNHPTTQTVSHPQLAETGTDVSGLGVAGALSAGMMLGGVVLYRRSRAVRQD